MYDLYKKRVRFLYNFIASDTKYDALNSYEYYKDILSFSDFKKFRNFDCSRSKKRKRCFDKFNIITILACISRAKMVFGTITLNDTFFALSNDNQKKVIQRYLKKHYFYVIKNADYGSKTERLHYHFIGLTFDDIIPNGKKSKKGRDMYNLKNDTWKYGFAPNIEIIPYDCEDKKKISNYLVKLNNHSNKITTSNTRLSILKNKDYLKSYDLRLANILFD